jgi:putative nucleotidyltransferase with HDIG domain
MPEYPVHAQSRDRLLKALDARSSAADLAHVLWSDTGLAVAVLRAAKGGGGEVPGLVDAVELVGPDRLRSIASGTTAFEPLGSDPQPVERLRLHAVAVQRAAERVLGALGEHQRDEVITGALLHDVGKLALAHADPDYRISSDLPPLDRLARERAEHGADHATVGFALAREWGLPERLADVIGSHHSPEAEGDAAIVRMADMLAHYEQGAPVEVSELEATAAALGLGRELVGTLLYELPYPVRAGRPPEPCPLSLRELAVLRKLGEGKVYKQIAADEGIASSTVRNYLHSAYAKLGVVDRAQAVLMAADRGWI